MKFALSSLAAAAVFGLMVPAFAASPPAPMAAVDGSKLGASTVEPVKPTACSTFQADAKSKAIGQWTLKQRDDGQDWSGPWDIEFKPDGTWVQGGEDAGYWCQMDDLFFFGFSSDPHTTYRGLISGKNIQGVESWNGGGTGIFEATRIN